MSSINPGTANIAGQAQGAGETSLLNPVYLFNSAMKYFLFSAPLLPDVESLL